MRMHTMVTEPIDSKNLLYPPGGLLIWGLVLMELLTFGAALIAFIVASKSEPDAFHNSAKMLNPLYGVANTVFLLTSGFFMAQSVNHYKEAKYAKSRFCLILTLLGGGLFLVLKAVEYHEKISQGLTVHYNTFFSYYWLLTLFHVMHVLAGIVILSFMMFRFRISTSKMRIEDYEAGAVFWHMCDLIWLILFPVIYLLL